MNNFDLFLRPVITEKATASEKAGKYQFFVRKDATKISVRQAFEKLYGVKVSKMNMLQMAEKTKSGRTRVAVIKKHALKKVIITTQGKKTVDITKPKFKE